MYTRIVRQTVEQGFQRLSQGDPEAILSKFSPTTNFRFLGDHAIGANLSTPGAIRQWFERILRLFPGIEIVPSRVQVSGMPWDTLVVVQLAIRVPLPEGRSYRNTGMQMLRLRWGRVIEDYVVEDTVLLVNALQELAQRGVSEAAAAPITD
ncbi:MAG: nuclear transport factor 2 family protein [Chloroflexota bacterium]